MKTVFIHPFAGVLSAYGMGLADIRAIREQAVEATLSAKIESTTPGHCTQVFQTTADHRADRVRASSATRNIHLSDVRYCATRAPTRALDVDLGRLPTGCGRSFETAHKAQFGFIHAPAQTYDRRSCHGRGQSVAASDSARPTCMHTAAAVRQMPWARHASTPMATGTTRRSMTASVLQAGIQHRRPRPHHRSPRHHRRRTRLAGRHHRATTTWC